MWLWLQKLMNFFQGEAEQRVEEEVRSPVNPAPRQLKAKTKNIYPKERANNRDTDDFRSGKERQFRFPVVPDAYQVPKRKEKEAARNNTVTREQVAFEQERNAYTRETSRTGREVRENREMPVAPRVEQKIEKQPPARFEPNREQTRRQPEKQMEKVARPPVSSEEKKSYKPSEIISPVYGKITPATREVEHRIHTTSGIVYPRLEQEEQLNQLKQWEKEIAERYFPEEGSADDMAPELGNKRGELDAEAEAGNEVSQAAAEVASTLAPHMQIAEQTDEEEEIDIQLATSVESIDLAQLAEREVLVAEADEQHLVEFAAEGELTSGVAYQAEDEASSLGIVEEVREAEEAAHLEATEEAEEAEAVVHLEATEEAEEAEAVVHLEATKEVEEAEEAAHLESTEEVEEAEAVAHLEAAEEVEEAEEAAHLEATEEAEEAETVAHLEATEEVEEAEEAAHLEPKVIEEETAAARSTLSVTEQAATSVEQPNEPAPLATTTNTSAAEVSNVASYTSDVNRLLERAGLDQQPPISEPIKQPMAARVPISAPVSEPVKEQEPVQEPEPPPYVKPQLELLNPSPPPSDDDDEHTQLQKLLLEETLSNFNVSAHVVGIVKGPSVTRFELQPAPGVKVNKITSLVDDIKLNLAAKDIRIEAPIPGRNAIGIEVPNLASQPVLIEKMIGSEKFHQHPSPLAVALGMDIGGEPIIADIKKMPHGLIAGSTGSGKSVCINSIIVSLLYKATPEQVRLLLIDPKMVELAPYNHLPHLITPVVTEAKQATAALKWCVEEMEKRYALFVDAGVRDIDRYNQTTDDPLPYIVIVIDELADLMMVSPQDVEDCIIRIAQKARACGIHLLLATQRPSVDVITGNIKANVPTRLAFAVFSQVDSRTILDQSGAERLLGRGDMLFLESGTTPVRLQGNFVSDDEIERITQVIKKQRKPAYLFSKEDLEQQVQSFDVGDDPLYLEALVYVAEQGQASASGLQRRFRVGYNRAARLIEMMESDGYVAGQSGGKARAVLISLEDAQAVVEGSTLV
ncbi:DNA translocase FtsK [Brevibacillus reuszeri]|uniref:DNA translocase FtsK n=1 Tax=Brevibacillus reuszeri TaxID=54915 RepID=UPI003D213C61